MRGTIPHVPGSGVFMIQPKDIDEYGRVNWWQVTETELTGRAEPRWLEPGDVIFRMNGKANLATYIDRVEVPGLVVCSHQFFHLKVIDSGIDPEFLAWLLNSKDSQQALSKTKSVASTGPVVNKKMLSSFEIQIPNKRQQSEVLAIWAEFLVEQRILKSQLMGSVERYDSAVRNIILDKPRL